MSAEGKKKRGMAGMANAAANPFRMNGWAPDWQARAIGAYRTGGAPSGGSRLMRGLVGGFLAQAVTGAKMVGDFSESAIAHAAKRVTSPLLSVPEDEPLAAA